MYIAIIMMLMIMSSIGYLHNEAMQLVANIDNEPEESPVIERQDGELSEVGDAIAGALCLMPDMRGQLSEPLEAEA